MYSYIFESRIKHTLQLQPQEKMHFTHLPNLEHDLVRLRPLEASDMDDWYDYLRLPGWCPEFCVNGASVKSWASSLQTGW